MLCVAESASQVGRHKCMRGCSDLERINRILDDDLVRLWAAHHGPHGEVDAAAREARQHPVAGGKLDRHGRASGEGKRLLADTHRLIRNIDAQQSILQLANDEVEIKGRSTDLITTRCPSISQASVRLIFRLEDFIIKGVLRDVLYAEEGGDLVRDDDRAEVQRHRMNLQRRLNRGHTSVVNRNRLSTCERRGRSST